MKKKRQNAKAPLAQFVAIIALSISIFLIVDLGRRAAANYRVQREAERLEQQVMAAKEYHTQLLARRSYAASDLYVEEVARKELKWTQQGEIVTVVLPEREAAPLPSPKNSETILPSTLPVTPQQAWWELFFGASPPIDDPL